MKKLKLNLDNSNLNDKYMSSVKSGHLPAEFVTRMGAMIRKSWQVGIPPTPSQLSCAAALASHGHLTRVEKLTLKNMDISSVEPGDLRTLVKCVTEEVSVDNVTGDLSPVLHSSRCRALSLYNRTLTATETQTLAVAMVSGVKEVRLGKNVTLGMETLTQYNGKGECEEVKLFDNTKEIYQDQVKVWAGDMDWEIENDDQEIIISRGEKEPYNL